MKIMELERRLYQHAEALKQSMTAPFACETEDFIMKKAAEKQSSLRGCLPFCHSNGNICRKLMPWGPACRPAGGNADAGRSDRRRDRHW